MGKIHELPKSSSRLLTSAQIITSVYCIVKELVENALDGASKNIEVKIEDFGLEKIEVKDNGTGIDKSDLQFVAKPHFTSKIATYSDLGKVHTYGFRGEALGAICAVADLTITTKSCEESVGSIVSFNHEGEVISTKPCPCVQGTTVTVQNLFKNIPVRKQYYRSEKNKKDDMRKVEELLMAYGCIQNDVRFALYHNRNLIWQKPAFSSTKEALIHVFGKFIVDHLKYSEHSDEQNKRKYEMYLPKLDAPSTCGLTSSSRCITSINKRPVRIKPIDKLLKEYYNKAIQNAGKARYPICYISFAISLTEVDVNVEPNKTNVLLHHSDEILAHFSEMLKEFYSADVTEHKKDTFPPDKENSTEEQKSNTSDFLSSLKVNCDAKYEQTKHLYTTENAMSSKDNSVDKISVNSVKKNSVEKAGSMCKTDIVKIRAADEPCRKKLKTTIKVSTTDVDHHIKSLKDYFAEDKINGSSPSSTPLNSLSTIPAVTVERVSHNQNNSNPEVGNTVNNNSVSERITALAVSSGDHSAANSDVASVNQKRHFSDSSVSDDLSKEPCVKKPVTGINMLSGEAWSRGQLSGGVFEPVKVLQPKPISTHESEPTKSPERINGSKQSVCSEKKIALERKLTAFDLFCRNNRLEVAAQNPDFTNQQIALVLSEKWNQLSPEEKAVYKNMLDKEYKQEVKKKEHLGKIVSRNLESTSNKSPRKPLKKKMKRKLAERTVPFINSQIKEFWQNKNREKTPSDYVNIINYLAPGIWVCARKEKIYLLNTFRLQETIIYHRLLETFQFTCDPLDTPQSITASNLGDECFEILKQLCSTEVNSSAHVLDARLTANGFDVKITKGMQNEVVIELVGITNKIAFYGIQDLKEIMMLIKSKGSSVKLSDCRPGKIMFYLQSEANRMSRNSPACQRVQDVEHLLNQKHSLTDECMHHKPLYTELWNIVSE